MTNLSEKKRQLLELMRQEKLRAKARVQPQDKAGLRIEPRQEGDPLPLSFGQERLWFLQQLEPEKAAYRIPAAVRMDGPLDVAIMERALNEVIRRHEILRTSFKVRDGLPVLDVAPVLRFELPRFDLEGVPTAGREEAASRFVSERARMPFDLRNGPLFRIELVRLEERSHVLLVILHHTISDTWSIGVFIRETAALYEAFSRGEPSPLPELPVQYPDFARWQRRYIQGEVLERQLAWWKERLGSISTVLELPTDRPRPPVQTFRGAREYMTLGARLTQDLQDLAQREEVSPFMAVLGGIATLLHRWSGQEDVLVGTPFSNRNRSEVEGLIGFFVNTLVLRSSFAGDPTFRELLGRIKETTLGAFAQSDVPFERIVEALQAPRDMSRNPVWQVDFAFQNAPMPRLEVAGLALSRFEIEESASRFDLEFDLRETSEGYHGWIGYCADLFEPDTIARMTRQLRTLLEGIAADPSRRVSELPLMTNEEQAELVGRCSRAVSFDSGEMRLHRLFEAQAARDPEAVAVTCEGQALSYGELNRRASRLARHLRGLGVGPETLVGLCLERSPEMLVGILGILKAGGAYVPLDPSYPQERLAFLLADARAPVLVTTAALLPRLPGVTARVVRLDADASAIAQHAGGDLDGGASPEDLAYVIYTSGSTGRPKGTLVTHANVARLFAATDEWFGFGPEDVWTLFHSYAFDFSVWEIWGALLYGGRLVVVPYWVSSSPEAFHELLRSERVTVLNQTPSAFLQLQHVDEEAGTPELALRNVIFGGEALETRSLRSWLERRGDGQPRLINMYGITETTVHVTYRPVILADLHDSPRSSVGGPIPDLEVWLLDGYLQPVPDGVPGEIFVGGPGLARGYFGRQELTAQRFVAHPWSTRPGARLYRSGDLARRLPGGDLHYLGRGDQQVKIRGFRIELGEIEAALAEHPAIREVAVLARGAGSATRLVAFIVSERDPAPGVDELRGFLKDRLPDYMVPSAFVSLEMMPLTAHGKLDRRALPDPDPGRPELATEYVAPRSPVEEGLAAIWADVLGLERIGVHDNFFELGGQSLLATQVTSRIRDAFQVDLSLRALFQQPTVATLASTVEAARRDGGAGAAPAIVQVPRDRELPLSFAQERLWFIHQLMPGISAYNIPGAVRLTGPLDRAVLEATFREIVRRHEVLRTTFATVEGRPVQVIHPEMEMGIPLVDLRGLSEEPRQAEAHRLANKEARRPFDLARGPLVRGTLLRIGDGVHLLVLNIHHIVYDMWSRVVFIRELGVLYEAFSAGRPSPLPPMALQYADFAHWQRQWMQGEVQERQLDYWRGQLAGIPAALELPLDRPRPAAPSFRGARAYVRFSPELTVALKDLAQTRGVTLYIVLLSGFVALLHRYSRQRDIVVGSPIANRNRMEVEGLIGFFANTLVLRSRFQEGITFRALLEQVRDTALGAFAHQDLAFERLVGELQPDREKSRHPLVQVLFNFIQNYRPPDMILGNLTLSPEWVHNGSAAFDFVLSLWEADQRLQGAMDYSVDLFEESTPFRLLRHLETLLESAARDPETRVEDLDLLQPDEVRLVVEEWNETRVPYRRDRCLHDWIEEQVDRAPDATAVVFEERQLGYRELDERANQLARHLLALGVRRGSRVGVCLDRSLEMVVALLGVLKAGAAYVPLDPSYPEDRLGWMIGDARVPVILTQERWLGIVPAGARSVALDSGWSEVAVHSSARLASGAGPEDAAYVIYTSGSTGRPKGAVVHHDAICNRLLWMQDEYGLEPAERVLQKTPFSFDVSVWELFWPLMTGACLVMARPGGHQDPLYLVRTIQKAGITTVHFVPSMLRAFLDEPSAAGCRGLRRVVCSGEALPPDLQEKHFAMLGVPLFNLYGPTEAAVDVTSWECRPGDGSAVPIGRPIANVRTYVLDAALRPVPVGVPGELGLAGAGLGRGYLGRPELTAGAFTPCPFPQEPGDRMYRTGDLARWRPDGSLEFLGRIDQQVKVRGFRVELGEVEAALAEIPGLRESAVVVREDRSGNRFLAACVVPAAGEPVHAEALRTFLRRRLPDYMVPSALIELEALPLSPNGKVDRRALQNLAQGSLLSDADLVAPRNDLEAALVRLWGELLGVEPERIGIHTSFFHVGGHSLLTTQLLSRLRDAFGVEVALPTFFEAPTVAGVAEAIEVARWAGETAAAMAVPAEDLAEDFEECEL